jgi:hypothetical protein
MRSLPALLALLSVATLSARAADVQLKRVWPQWYAGDSFQSLYEDRTGKELTGKRTLLRSRPDERAGLYFLTRVENTGSALPGTTFTVRVISPESTDTRVFNFPADVPAGSWLFQIGLTGKDWAGARIEPVAWEVELRSADGRILAQAHSFLWERPGR